MKHFSKLHYPAAILGMMAGIFLSYITFYYANRMVVEAYFEEKDIEETRIFQYENAMLCQYDCGWDAVEACFAAMPGNVTVTGMPLYIDAMNSEHMTRIILKRTEQMPYRFVEGAMPEEQDVSASQPCVVLGKENKTYTTHRKGSDYIRICGEEYLVTGYIAAKHSVIYDHAVILFGNRLGGQTKEAIDYYASLMGAELVLQSNEVDVGKQYQQLNALLQEKGIQSMRMEEFDPWFSTDVTSLNYRAYAYLIYLFSICVLIMVTEFWIAQRRREIAIRRLDGFCNIQIIGLIAKDIMKILLMVSGMLFVLQILLSITNKDDMSALGLVIQLAIALVFIVVTFALLMLYPLVKIKRMEIADAVKEGGR